MPEISFFTPKGPFNISELSDELNSFKEKITITDIKTLDKATKSNISFFNSLEYLESAKSTKAAACITTKNLKQYLPKHCISVEVKNVLFTTAKIASKFYPNADIDYPDHSVVEVNKISNKFDNVTFGKNIFI